MTDGTNEMAASDSIAQNQPLVIVRQFRDVSEAQLAKTLLDSAGIESFLGDENLIRMDWFLSNLLGGVKLWVRKADAEAALNMLQQAAPEIFVVEGQGEYKQPHCPRCQSLDISFQEMILPADYVWECASCGHRWPEADAPPNRKANL